MKSRTVFYSWQLDSDDRFNRRFIDDCLKQAIRKLEVEDISTTVIHRDTKEIHAKPNVGMAVLDKLARSAFVVADLSIINPKSIRRPGEWAVCNPTVSFEVGCAWGALGADSVIGVVNTAYGDVKELPVELRVQRLVKYNLSNGDDRPAAMTQLVDDLADAITECTGVLKDERRRRVARLHGIFTRIWLLGTEIDEWSGIDELANVIQQVLAQAQQLPDLMRKIFDSDDVLGRAVFVIHSLDKAAALTVTEENLPEIRRHLAAAASTAILITRQFHFAIDPCYQIDLFERVAAIPAALDRQIKLLRDGHYHRRDLEELSYELRTIAFKQIMSDQPQFCDELLEISFDFRSQFLRWVKCKPKRDAAINAIQELRDRLATLFDSTRSASQERVPTDVVRSHRWEVTSYGDAISTVADTFH